MASEKQKLLGQCALCKKLISKTQMTRHLKKCIEKNTESRGQKVKMFHLVIEGRYLPMYWLHVEIPGAMMLEDLDDFLRGIWLECCGHLSCFTIDKQRYSSHPAEDYMFASEEKTMQQKIYKVLSKGVTFQHEYDYGSTTELKLRVVDVVAREVEKPCVTLLERNDAPAWVCTKCGKPATRVHQVGWGVEEDSLYCDDCLRGDEAEERCLPLVNSPRTGVCGYTGPIDDDQSESMWDEEEDAIDESEEAESESIIQEAGSAPGIELWKQLYSLADQIKKLAPWQWMEEVDVFGVQFLETEEFGYVSVMGMEGKHHAVSVYLGDQALNKFWDIQLDEQKDENAERILEMPQLMLSFENRDMLQKEDLDIIKELRLKYRGENAWPLFRSYRPGFYPWFLEKDEAERLAVALEQALGMAMRTEDDPELLMVDVGELCPIRISSRTENGLLWTDSTREIAAPEPFTLKFRVDLKEMNKLKKLPGNNACIDLAFFLTPSPVAERGERPSFTYMMIAVESESCFVLGFELLQALDGLHRMWEDIPASLVAVLNKAEFMPREIRVASPRLCMFIGPIAEELGIETSLHDSLPALDEARAAMFEFVSGQR